MSETRRGRGPYPPEFRRRAVELYRSSGKGLKAIAEELGIADESLRSWNKQFEVDRRARAAQLGRAWAGQLPPGGIDLFPGVRSEGSKNSGVAFGLLSETGDLVVVVVLVALAGLVAAMLASRRLGNSAAAAGCVLGGGIANLGDRLGDGAVTAFIDIGAWPSFNLADTALTVGVVWWVSATARGQAEHGASRCI